MAKAAAPPTVSASSRSKPHHAKPYSAPASGPISISKTKSNLRQATRLLAKDSLDAQLRVETERRVESLQRELDEALKQRPAVDQQKGAGGDVANSSKQQNDAKGKGKQKEENKKGDKYKMLKHFEYRKAARRCKKCRKELATAEEELAALEESDPDEKKKIKKLRKSVERLQEELFMARIDAWYVETFPKSLKYVSLYPPAGHVEFTLSSLSVPTGEDDLSGMPSNKKPDEVRQYWRSIVKAKLDKGEMTGEPVKEKKEKKPKKSSATAEEDSDGEDEEVDGSAGEASDSSSGESGVAEEEEQEEEKDDFFA